MTTGEGFLPTARPDFDERDLSAIGDVLDSRWLGAGRVVERFEASLVERTGAEHVVAVATGTAALHLGLLCGGTGPGSEVVMPSMTFVATVQAALACGARPVFSDIDPTTGLLDPLEAELATTRKTSAILPVHYGGQVADMSAIRKIASTAGCRTVEDAAHSFGSSDAESVCGGASDVACFSFDPIKPLTCGQGGAVATNDADLAALVLRTSDLGIVHRSSGGNHTVEGFGLRYRMSDLNAAIGLSQLERFDDRAHRRREIWRRYADACAPLEPFTVLDHHVDTMVPFLFAVRVVSGRSQVRAMLRAAGVGTGVHYEAAHLHACFAEFSRPLPVAEEFSSQIMTLPFFPSMTDEEVEHVVLELERAADSLAAAEAVTGLLDA